MRDIIYEHILDAAGIGYWEIEIPSLIVNHSLRHDQILGFTDPIQDLSYEKFLTFVLPEDLEKVKTNFDAVNRHSKEFNIEYRIVREDGAIRWVWSFVVPFRDDSGTVVSIVGLLKDITDEYAITAQLEKTQAITNQFLEHIDLVFYQTSQNGTKIKYLNNEVEKISGKPLEYFIGVDKWLDLVVPQDAAKVKQYYLGQAHTNTRQESMLYKIKSKDGSIRNLLDKCFVANDKTNKVVGILGIIADLTEIDLKNRVDSIFGEVTHAFHDGNSLQQSVDSILKVFCSGMAWSAGEVWLLDETKTQLYRFSVYPPAESASEGGKSDFINLISADDASFTEIFESTQVTYIKGDNKLSRQNYPLCVALRLEHERELLGLVCFFITDTNNLPHAVTELFVHLADSLSMYLQQKFTRNEYFMAKNYDLITGLMSRNSMITSLQELIATQPSKTVVVVKMLIDQIDKINNVFGVTDRNLLLKDLTVYLLSNPNPNVYVISSDGYNGFVFVFKTLTSVNDVNLSVQSLLNVNKEVFNVHGGNISITCSIGVSCYPQGWQQRKNPVK